MHGRHVREEIQLEYPPVFHPEDWLRFVETAIFTQDIGRANRVAQRIHVGLTWINCWFLRDLRTSFGGSKASGIGREGGIHSFEFYTDLRNVMVKF